MLLAAMACSITFASAQGLKFGVVGGMNLTKLRISSTADRKHFGSDNQTGWYIGGKLVASTGFGLGADVALEYSKQMLDINDDATAYHTLEIPLNVRFNFFTNGINNFICPVDQPIFCHYEFAIIRFAFVFFNDNDVVYIQTLLKPFVSVPLVNVIIPILSVIYSCVEFGP